MTKLAKFQELFEILKKLWTNYPLEPTIKLNSNISKLNINQLRQENITALILDLDNTIMLPDAGVFFTEIIDWLQDMQAQDIKIIILSNNLKKNYLRQVSKLLNQYNLEIIGIGAKPWRENILKSMNKLKMMDARIQDENIAIVGDRILTDILGGIHTGIKSILVKPLIGNDEIWYKRLGRQFEYLFVKAKL